MLYGVGSNVWYWLFCLFDHSCFWHSILYTYNIVFTHLKALQSYNAALKQKNTHSNILPEANAHPSMFWKRLPEMGSAPMLIKYSVFHSGTDFFIISGVIFMWANPSTSLSSCHGLSFSLYLHYFVAAGSLSSGFFCLMSRLPIVGLSIFTTTGKGEWATCTRSQGKQLIEEKGDISMGDHGRF